MSSVAIQVNEQSLVQNLRLAFTTPTTYLAELMQNARRAGASRVEFTYDPELKVLVVVDDGEGISDMQNLLCIAQSGWDEAIKDEEKPYGMGFLSALFQADSVEVYSGAHRMEFTVEDALAFRPIEVEASISTAGTMIRLFGIEQDPGQALKGYARGFPIPVFFNGEEFKRPHALDGDLKFEHTDIGACHFVDIDHEFSDDRKVDEDWLVLGSERFALYLQGLPIFGTRQMEGRGDNIIHLDSTRFFGRLPDRTNLVDQEAAEKAVLDRIRQRWSERLEALHSSMEAEAFAHKIYDTLVRWNRLDLLNDVDYLPDGSVFSFARYPIRTQHWEEDDHFDRNDEPIPRSRIESGEVKVATGLEMEEATEDGFQAVMYCYSLDIQIMETMLDPDHWVYRYAKRVANTDVMVSVSQSHRVDQYVGASFCIDTLLTDSVSLEGPFGTVDIEDGFYYEGKPLAVMAGGAGNACRVAVITPKTVSEIIRQIDSFEDEWDFFQDVVAEEERDLFEHYLKSLQNGTETDLLRALLSDARVGRYDNLKGKTFKVSIGSHTWETHVELIDNSTKEK